MLTGKCLTIQSERKHVVDYGETTKKHFSFLNDCKRQEFLSHLSANFRPILSKTQNFQLFKIISQFFAKRNCSIFKSIVSYFSAAGMPRI